MAEKPASRAEYYREYRSRLSADKLEPVKEAARLRARKAYLKRKAARLAAEASELRGQ